jgi:hypothetical protein
MGFYSPIPERFLRRLLSLSISGKGILDSPLEMGAKGELNFVRPGTLP